MKTVKSIITDLAKLDEQGRAEEIDIKKENKEMREIITFIKRTMRKNNLVSLSAPAIGYNKRIFFNKRIFCVDYSDNEIKTYINPVIMNSEGLQLSREVCSALPGKEFIRPRHSTIDIIYTNPQGIIKSNQFKGLAATVIQHELDHLDGITLADIGLEIESDFDEGTEEEKFEIINMYLDSLDLAREDLIKDFQKDENLKKEYEADKFMEMLGQGKIKLEAVQAVKEE